MTLNNSLSFDNSGIDNGVDITTAASFIASSGLNAKKIVYRGVPSSVAGLLDPDTEASGKIVGFTMVEQYDYNPDNSRTKNGLFKPFAFVLISEKRVKISLREDQTNLKINDVVIVKASNEYYKPNDKTKILSAEIL
jgi:hypothetical protein